MRINGRSSGERKSSDTAKRQIVCISSFDRDAPETFTLENLTPEVVENHLKRFAYLAAGGKRSLSESSVYDQRLRNGDPLLQQF